MIKLVLAAYLLYTVFLDCGDVIVVNKIITNYGLGIVPFLFLDGHTG